MKTIDAHVHFAGDHPECLDALDRMDLRLLNVCVAFRPGQWDDQRAIYRRLAREHPARYAWCTTFDPPDSRGGAYVERVIAQLQRDLSEGAVGCKIWKNIGMETRTTAGDYLMVDDPVFAPIFDLLQRIDCPVLMHIGEPISCWLPLHPASPYYDYYSTHLEWHMHGKPGVPSHERLMAARDHVLEHYPGIRFIGAHLASLGHDIPQIAARLDRYPNLAIDTSARMPDLAIVDTEALRRFFIAYADRILYGSDFYEESIQSTLPEQQRREKLRLLKETYAAELSFLRSGEDIAWAGKRIKGLGLPAAVAEKITHGAAHAIYGL